MRDYCRNTASFLQCSFLLLVFLTPTFSWSQQNLLVLTDASEKHSLKPPIYYFEDPSREHRINEIVQLGSDQFSESDSSTINLGIKESSVWVVLIINNRATNTNISDWYLEIEEPQDNVSLYIPHPDGSYRVKQSGKWVPQIQHDIRHRNTVFLLPVYPRSRASENPHLQTYYLQFHNNPFLHFSFAAYSSNGFLQKEKRENSSWGIFFGIIGFIFFVNCILYMYLKDPLYLYYFVFIALFALFQLSNAGILQSLLSVIPPVVFNYCIPFSLCLTCLFFMQFTSEAIGLKKRFPIVYRIVSLGSAVYLAPVFFLSFGSYPMALITAVSLVPVTSILSLSLTLLPRKNTNKQLQSIFLISWGPFLLTGTALSLQRFGITFLDIMPYSLINVFLIIGGVFFTFYQGYTMIQLKQQKTEAIHEANRLRDFIDKIDITSRYDERLSIAREIHDTVGYALTTVLSQVRATETLLDPKSDPVLERLDRVKRVIEYAMDNVRNEVSVLRKESNNQERTEYRLSRLTYLFSRSTGVDITTRITPDIRINPPLSESLYRITQEAFTNAYRHGRATVIDLTLELDSEAKHIRLDVSDNGKGLKPDFKEGSGIAGMRERAEEHQGEFKLSSGPKGGVKVLVQFPVCEDTLGEEK